jgi:hypothetical protein
MVRVTDGGLLSRMETLRWHRPGISPGSGLFSLDTVSEYPAAPVNPAPSRAGPPAYLCSLAGAQTPRLPQTKPEFSV